jgi:hypothetical protein
MGGGLPVAYAGLVMNGTIGLKKTLWKRTEVDSADFMKVKLYAMPDRQICFRTFDHASR